MDRSLFDIRTERLFLREITKDDTSKIVEWRSDPKVYKYFLNPHRLTAQEHILWFNNEYAKNPDRVEWMCYKGALPVGVFGVKRKNNEGQEAEISYLVDIKVRQNGYAREAIEGILIWAVDKWNITSMFAEIHRSNMASRAFIEKLGFENIKRERDFLIYRKELIE